MKNFRISMLENGLMGWIFDLGQRK